VRPEENEAGRSERRQNIKWEKVKDLRICTWNVLPLYRSRALKTLTDRLDKYKTDITALQDVRWSTGEKRMHGLLQLQQQQNINLGLLL
jgi:hypothetical protein